MPALLRRHSARFLAPLIPIAPALLLILAACHPAPAQTPLHTLHAAKLGRLDCNLCHTPSARGSVELKPPGHDQCRLCHQPAFENRNAPAICASCHQSPSPGPLDLSPFPKHTAGALMLTRFSHALHLDAQARKDPATGFRADCVFCHDFSKGGHRAGIAAHTQCAACHSQPGIQPALRPFLPAAGCRECHAPEEKEQALLTGSPRPAALAGRPDYPNIRFSHAAHFQAARQFKLECATCHSAIAESKSLAGHLLPRMIDCAACHDASRQVPAELKTRNCAACHLDSAPTSAAAGFNRAAKPAFHTAVFRRRHQDQAAAQDAKCFACHQNTVAWGGDRCISCHLVMRPVSHTARWRDDIHGKSAALDRQSCTACHATDYCSRCHNELPNSHLPLPLFKNGGHARLAMLNERSCLTCHTFQNTCSSCHVPGLLPGVRKR